MTRDQFHIWLNNSTEMDVVSIPQIREVVQRYPYFQVAQAMLAKNLKQQNHIDQLVQLQLAAIMAPDRKVFYDYLHDERKAVVAEIGSLEVVSATSVEPDVTQEPEPKSEVVSEVLPESGTVDRDPLYDLIPEPIVYQLEKAISMAPDSYPLEMPELPVEESVTQEPTALSFSEWLAFTESGITVSDKKDVPTEETKHQTARSGIELIEHFLTQHTNAPKKRAEFFNPQKVATRSNQDDFTVVSETLAKIYVQQEKYELARQAYEALSLKYPEKSVYFAARLKEIDDLQNTEN
ncbi:MAG: hypothetical protein RL266_2840 [Bacteroidota bacterium]|jgi:hypothetical protein